MPDEQYVQHHTDLQSSSRPRTYWFAHAPDVPAERWYFESVDDAGEVIAIRQLVIEGDGTRHAYSVESMEDEWGFLTDQPLAVDEWLEECSAEEFETLWRDT